MQYNHKLQALAQTLKQEKFAFRSYDLECFFNNLWWEAPGMVRDTKHAAKLFKQAVYGVMNGRAVGLPDPN